MPVKGHSVSSLLWKAAVTLYFVLLLLPAAGFWQGGGRQQAVLVLHSRQNHACSQREK